MSKKTKTKKSPPCTKMNVKEKILSYLSSPRRGLYSSARQISNYIRAPLEEVEFCICQLSDMGLIIGVKEVESDEYFVRNMWIKI